MAHPYFNPVIAELDEIAQELEKTGNADLATLVDEVSSDLETYQRKASTSKTKSPSRPVKKTRKAEPKTTNPSSKKARVAAAMRKIARAQVAELEDIAAELMKEGDKKAALEVLKIADDLDSEYDYSDTSKHDAPESKGDASKRYDREKANKPDAKMSAEEKERLDLPFGEKGEGYPKEGAFEKELEAIMRLAEEGMEDEDFSVDPADESSDDEDESLDFGDESDEDESSEDEDSEDAGEEGGDEDESLDFGDLDDTDTDAAAEEPEGDADDLDLEGLDFGDEGEEGEEGAEEGDEDVGEDMDLDLEEGEDEEALEEPSEEPDDMGLDMDMADDEDELAAMLNAMEGDDVEASDRMYDAAEDAEMPPPAPGAEDELEMEEEGEEDMLAPEMGDDSDKNAIDLLPNFEMKFSSADQKKMVTLARTLMAKGEKKLAHRVARAVKMARKNK